MIQNPSKSTTNGWVLCIECTHTHVERWNIFKQWWLPEDASLLLQVNVTSWPHMTFDLGIWPLTSLTYEGSHVASMTRVSLQLVFVHYISARGFLYELWIFQMCIFLYSTMYTTLFKMLYFLYYMAYKIESDIYDAQCKNNNSLLWVTFDLGVWPLTSLTYDGFYIAYITQLSLQLLFVWGSNHTRQKVFTKLLTDTHTDTQTKHAAIRSFLRTT